MSDDTERMERLIRIAGVVAWIGSPVLVVLLLWSCS